MKRLFLILLFFSNFLFITCFAQVTIVGHVKNAQSGKIYLSIQKGNDLSPLDSLILEPKGDFVFKLNEGYKQGVYKLQFEKFKEAPIIIGKEKKITFNSDLAELKEGFIHIVSSKENDAYAVLSNFFSKYNSEIDSLEGLITDISRFDPQHDTKKNQLKSAYSLAILRFNSSIRLIPGMFPGTFVSEILCPLSLVAERSEFAFGKDFDTDEAFQHRHFFQYIDFSDERIVNTSTYEKKLFTYLDRYVEHSENGFIEGVDIIMASAKKNDKVNDFTLTYLLDIFTAKGPPQLVAYVHDNFSQNCDIPMKSDTKNLLNKLKLAAKGSAAPEMEINDINNKPVSMKSTLNGKLGMIYFWASTCPHCMEYSPKVFDIYQKYKSKGFEVYAVSLDNDYSAWLKAIQDMKLEWVNVSELKGWKSSVIETYGLERTPSIFLVDKEGTILDKDFSPSDLESKLKKLLP